MNQKYKTEAERAAAKLKKENEWRARHSKLIQLRFNNEEDCVILSKLSAVDNKTEYIRNLILADINK